MILPRGVEDAPILEHAFDEYERIAGLRLHRGKTVWVPLSLDPLDQVRARLHAAAPTWGEFAIRRHATYLGFVVGPERGELSWNKPLEKFLSRARVWRDIGRGMFYTIMAHRVYMFPVLGFLLQLGVVPSNVAWHEQRACSLLFPGPRSWISPAALRHLISMGFPTQLPDEIVTALAAECCVHQWEARERGGLQIVHDS